MAESKYMYILKETFLVRQQLKSSTQQKVCTA